ncbi:hypothetical protein [Nocardia aurantiaca]|uniref:Uncharacterized protein n=1 Tax=Nocardia aurantiaca TaxID=2675850 RepID=A0A6I3KS21_9NOCA|nr:hypothetical protein [Nocardia aurantiaca]MTE12287.1 hypothetical protein [Nocardia aurantiaca]
MNAPIGPSTLIVVTRVLHLPLREKTRDRVDYWGAPALIVAMSPLLIVAQQDHE